MSDKDCTICKDCLAEDITCERHFNLPKLYTHKDIVLHELDGIKRFIPFLFENIYNIESISKKIRFQNVWHTGTYDYKGFNEAYVMYNGQYYPLESYVWDDSIVQFNMRIKVDMARHHTTTVYLSRGRFGEPDGKLCAIELLKFMDCLHCESIREYNEIVAIATKRLQKLIDTITNTNEYY